jgi:GNAT superfamily N-acetyltransferase
LHILKRPRDVNGCSDRIPLEFVPLCSHEPGLIASLPRQSYAVMLETHPEIWASEVAAWERYDRDVFARPDTVGACLFLSQLDTEIVGFASYDPSPCPALGIVGHNCILPALRRRGFGTAQVREVLRRLRSLGIRVARVSTLDDAWLFPARRMYASCGFRERARHPWDRYPSLNVIEYERALSDLPSLEET